MSRMLATILSNRCALRLGARSRGCRPGGDGVLAPLGSRADLFDENDREMGEMVLSWEISRQGEGIEVAGQLLRCDVGFEMGEVVASVDVPSRMAVLPAGSDRILTARGTNLSTRRGNGYWSTMTLWT